MFFAGKFQFRVWPRRMWKFFALLLVFAGVQFSAQFQHVKIGAIFFEDEVDIENAFMTAVSRMNLKFFETKLIPIKRYAPSTEDSMVLQRLVCELISNGVAAIFGPSSKTSSDIVALIANDTGIPHLTYDWSREETVAVRDAHVMTVNLAPPVDMLSRAYADILTNYGWSKYTVIYESDEGLQRLQDILQLRRIHAEEVRIRKISRGDDYRILWKNLRQAGVRHIVLDCPPDMVKEVMNASMYFNMTGQFTHYLLTDLDTHEGNLQDLYGTNLKANLSAVRLEFNELGYLETELLQPNLIFDAVQLYSFALKSMMDYQSFIEPRLRCDNLRRGERWILGKLLLKHMRKMSDQNDTFITQSLQLNEHAERVHFNLEIYRPISGATMGLWNPQELLTITSTKRATSASPKRVLMDVTDIRPHYRVATRIGTPYLMLREVPEGEILLGNQRYMGYAVDLIHKLSIQADFDYTFEVVEDNAYGNYNPETKEWNGIVRYLIDGKADIGICDLTITQARRSVVDFTVPFMSLGISILYYNTPPEKKGLTEFLGPFTSEVWYSIGTAYLLSCLLYVVIARLSEKEWENPNPANPNPEELENIWNMHNAIWLTMGCLMQQGCDILPKSGAVRMISGMWWFFVVMIVNAYIANLAAVITSEKYEGSIKSIKDLTSQNKIRFGTLTGGSTSNFFKESNDSVYRLAWSKMMQAQPPVFTKDNDEGVKMVTTSKGSYAFLMETTSLQYSMARDCNLTQVGNQIGEKHYGIAVPLGAEYRSNLSVAILKLSEKGELYSLKKKWWTEEANDCGNQKTEDSEDADEEDDPDSDENKMDFDKLDGVFLVLVLGLGLAYLMGIAEFFWNIQRIAVEEKILPWDAFKRELTFFLKFWIKKKPVIRPPSSDESILSMDTFDSHGENNRHDF